MSKHTNQHSELSNMTNLNGFHHHIIPLSITVLNKNYVQSEFANLSGSGMWVVGRVVFCPRSDLHFVYSSFRFALDGSLNICHCAIMDCTCTLNTAYNDNLSNIIMTQKIIYYIPQMGKLCVKTLHAAYILLFMEWHFIDFRFWGHPKFNVLIADAIMLT